MESNAPEVLLEGPAGTGKTFAILRKLHALAKQYPRFRSLIVRKFAVTLGNSVLPTLEEQVYTGWDNNMRRSVADGVHFYGGSEREAAAYVYDNGSRITIGGMDQTTKVLGAFYDVIFFNQAEEATIDDIETLKTRLRHGRLPDNRHQLYADCNPSYNRHPLLLRAQSGLMQHFKSRLQDNPRYYDTDAEAFTEAGVAYLGQLEGLTGTRRERLLLGQWIGMEDAIYPVFDPSLHVRPLEQGLRWETTIAGIDYGTEHLCAIVVMSIDQYRRRWVREVWAEADTDQGQSLVLAYGRLRQKYGIRRGRVDPNQAFLAGRLALSVAQGGSGGAAGPPRLHRIDILEPLFYNRPGGRVASWGQDVHVAHEHGPYLEGDTPGILFVEDGPGIDDLVEEIPAYHYVWTETPRGRRKDVYRMNENRIAALEYANEEYEEGKADYLSAVMQFQQMGRMTSGLRR